MTNGEITKPGNNSGTDSNSNSTVEFSKEAPARVKATKSYYENYIAVSWDKVTGADYYTIEKSEKDSSAIATASDVWSTIGETVTGTSYKDDSASLAINKYYSYRVTAHTYSGETGAASDVSVGTLLASPESLSASKGTSESAIIVSWTQMPYVESYEVYKAEISSVTGLKSELVDTLNSDEDEDTLVYSYNIDPAKEKGKELYFAVVGVGPTGEKATISNSRSGYTLVPGAPGKPSVSVSKGESNSTVSVHFKAAGDDSEYTYVIKRISAGSAESIVFSTEFDDISTLSTDENGNYVFEDSTVNPNIEYTYSVTAENAIGISEAGIETGYLLSPVQKIELVANKDKMGYEISVRLPLGADDSERTIPYTYTVSGTTQGGDSIGTETFSEEEFAQYVETKVFGVYSKEEYTAEKGKEEILCINVVVSNGKDSAASVSSNTISPPEIKSVTASEYNKPFDSDVANSNGVYPVYVSWTWKVNPNAVQTLIRKGSDGSELVIENAGANSYSDNSGTVPFVTYTYKLKATDIFGREFGNYVSSNAGYGALSASIFIDIFESVSLKPWDTSRQKYLPDEYKSYWTSSKIATLVGYGNSSSLSTQMKALDSAEDKDHYRDSKITYNASTEGVGGQIYFTYLNFGENANFYMTGNYEMHVNSSGTGSCASSTNGFEVYGMYPASISLSKISIEKKAFTGKYVITFNYKNGTGKGEVEAK